jgi:hypothetical protein
MHRLIDIAEWLLAAASAVAVVAVVLFAAMAFRLNHPPRD